MKYQKGFAPIIIILGIVLILGIVGGAYYYNKNSTAVFRDMVFYAPTTTPTVSGPISPVACTQEAKICPDGTSVGRTGPNCEFSECVFRDTTFYAPTTTPNVILLAKQDLSDTLAIDPSIITIVSYTQVEWSDSSLGCPKAGNLYAQVVTSGYKVIFMANQKQFEYHTDLNNQFVTCTKSP